MTTPGLVPYQPQSFPKIDFHFTRSLLRKGGATEVLSEWLDDFLDIAEVGLSDRPQLLEALLWCALSLVAGFDTNGF